MTTPTFKVSPLVHLASALVAALLVACGAAPAKNDAGMPAPVDSGTPDSGVPGSIVATGIDGGVDQETFTSATATWGAYPDGGLNPAVVLVVASSSVPQDQLCDATPQLFSSGGSAFLSQVDMDLVISELALYPDAGVAWTPGTFVAPDAGVLAFVEHVHFDHGVQTPLSAFTPSDPGTLTVLDAQVPTVELGTLYQGGRFTAKLSSTYPDGGAFDYRVDARGCDGNPLLGD